MKIKAKVVNLSLMDALSSCIISFRFEYRSLIRVSTSNYVLVLFICLLYFVFNIAVE